MPSVKAETKPEVNNTQTGVCVCVCVCVCVHLLLLLLLFHDYNFDSDMLKKAAELQAKIQAKLASAGLPVAASPTVATG